MTSYYNDIFFEDAFEYANYDSMVARDGLSFAHWLELCMNTSGEVILRRSDDVAVEISGPVIFWHSHAAKFAYGPPPGKVRGHIFIVAGGARMQRIFDHLSSLFPEGYMVPHESEAALLLGIMREIVREVVQRSGAFHGMTVAKLELLVAELTRIHAQRHAGLVPDSAISKLADRIRRKPMEPYCFEREIASKMGMSYSKFRALFRKTTGVSPHAFLMNCRLQYAMELLNSTTLQVKEVASQCGFENPISFYRFFRQRMKCTPQQFREHQTTISARP